MPQRKSPEHHSLICELNHSQQFGMPRRDAAALSTSVHNSEIKSIPIPTQNWNEPLSAPTRNHLEHDDVLPRVRA